jgi:DNA-directed RNA polymerase specialized sigma24 family protein
MPTATQKPPEPPADKSARADLQAQYVDLIDRYVRRRIPDPAQAERVVRDVFQKAGANPEQVQASPLPWLIGAARRACAQVRRATNRNGGA